MGKIRAQDVDVTVVMNRTGNWGGDDDGGGGIVGGSGGSDGGWVEDGWRMVEDWWKWWM